MHLSVLLLAAVALAQERPSAPPERAYSAFGEDETRQFDFWIGVWDVNLRMLQEDGSFRDTVRARAHIYSILDGRAILELWDSAPIKGYSLRYFDAETDAWHLWLSWPSENRSRTSSLTGSFRHGRGDFYSEREREDGTTLLSRFSFNDITPFSLRWDDHFSTDGGKTWRPSWIMEFSRTALEPEWPIPREEVPTYDDGGRCSLDGFRDQEVIAGEWEGTIEASGEVQPARLSAYRVLDGCAVAAFFEADGLERFAFLTFDTAREAWELDWLTPDPGSGLERFFGSGSWTDLQSEDDDARFRWEVRDDSLEYRLGGDGRSERGVFEHR